MSVIAWDGKSLAADKRASNQSTVCTTTKICKVFAPANRVYLLGWTGDEDSGQAVANWYRMGANVKEWPECQKGESWSRLIVVSHGTVLSYERQPFPVLVEDKFMSWGSGRDYARAAMHLGKTAREAVEVACQFDPGCGNGIDELTL